MSRRLHLYQQLWQTEIWRDRRGADRLIAGMAHFYRRNVLRTLRRLAPDLWRDHETELLLRNDDVAVALHRTVDPAVWIEDTPLARHLATLVVRDRLVAAGPRRWWR